MGIYSQMSIEQMDSGRVSLLTIELREKMDHRKKHAAHTWTGCNQGDHAWRAECKCGRGVISVGRDPTVMSRS